MLWHFALKSTVAEIMTPISLPIQHQGYWSQIYSMYGAKFGFKLLCYFTSKASEILCVLVLPPFPIYFFSDKNQYYAGKYHICNISSSDRPDLVSAEISAEISVPVSAESRSRENHRYSISAKCKSKGNKWVKWLTGCLETACLTTKKQHLSSMPFCSRVRFD